MKPIAHSLCEEAGVRLVSVRLKKTGLQLCTTDNGLHLVWYTVDLQYEVGLLRCWSWQIFSSIDGCHYETPTSATQHESMSCQLVAFFIKLDFTCPLKVAVFVGFLNNSSFDDVIAVKILTRFEK